MIQTTYIRLEKAAEMLKTDVETIIVGAIEGRVLLFGFLGLSLPATKFKWFGVKNSLIIETIEPEKDESSTNSISSEATRNEHTFCFCLLGRHNIIDIYREGTTKAFPIENDHQTEHSEDKKWDGYFGHQDTENFSRDKLFMHIDDVEFIKLNKSWPPTMYRDETLDIRSDSAMNSERKSASTRTSNTQHRIIGGLLQLMLHGVNEKGEKISKYTTADQVIKDMEDQFPTVYGLKKSNLETVFAEAKRAIKDA